MVVLGSWPFQHTITLDTLMKSTGEKFIYNVDNDKIVRYTDLSEDLIVDNVYHIAYSKDMSGIIDPYRAQIIPPPEPQGRRLPSQYEKEIEKVKESSLCLIINNPSSSLMEDIGAVWNHSLGTWIVDSEHMSTIRDRRRKKFDGKIYKAPHVDMTYKVWGDLTPHIEKLKSINAVYNEEDNVWIVKMSVLGKIAHIFSK